MEGRYNNVGQESESSTTSPQHLLRIREVVVNLLVEDVEYNVQEVPATTTTTTKVTWQLMKSQTMGKTKAADISIPHEEEEPGDKSRVLLQEPHAFPERKGNTSSQ